MNHLPLTRYGSQLVTRPTTAWVAFGLMLGLFKLGIATVLVFGQPARADSTTPPPIVKPSTQSDQSQKLLGQWLTKEPLEGETVMVVFTTEGKLFIISGTTDSGNGIAQQFQYRVDSTSMPTHLDIVIDNRTTVKTLFEFTTSGDLRLQILGTRPGNPRPEALADNATVFQKISDSATLPPGIEVKP